MKRILLTFLLLLTITACVAEEICESDRGIKTPFGRIIKAECSDSKGAPTRQWVSLDEQRLLEDKILSADLAIDRARAYWLYTGKSKWETGCPDRLYLIDLSMKPVKVTAFGVKKACNELHWASWGKERSVIALKNNVKFIYEHGKMTPPAAGETLWKAIEPPHAGAGLDLEHAVPFAEDVPLPK